jgi:hypothetical protein
MRTHRAVMGDDGRVKYTVEMMIGTVKLQLGGQQKQK